MCHVEPDKCRSCRSCLKVGCPAVSMEEGRAVIDRTQCVGCTVRAQVCPFGAIVKAVSYTHLFRKDVPSGNTSLAYS